MSTKKEKYVCNQCSRCAVENTAVLGCVDDDCPCHSQSESTVTFYEDLSPSCQVKTRDGRPLNCIPELKIIGSESIEWEKAYFRKFAERFNENQEGLFEDIKEFMSQAITTAVAKKETDMIEARNKKIAYFKRYYLERNESNEIVEIVASAVAKRELEIAEELEKRMPENLSEAISIIKH